MSQAYVPRSAQVKTAPDSPIEGLKVWSCELAAFQAQKVLLPEAAIRIREVVAVHRRNLPEQAISLPGTNLWTDVSHVYVPAVQPQQVQVAGTVYATYQSFDLEAQPVVDRLRHTVRLTWPQPTRTDPATGNTVERTDLPSAGQKVVLTLAVEDALPQSDYALEADADGQLRVLHIQQNFEQILAVRPIYVFYTAVVGPGFSRS